MSETVARASETGTTLRVVGSGHSFTPVVCCDGVILDIADLRGVQMVDESRHRARIWAGSTLASLGAPLWDAGLSLRNQGDIDAQTIAGAVSTGTHGTGLKFTSFSGAVTRAEIVTASGELLVIEENDPRLAAVQTSIGTLGVLTNVELQLMPAYQLAEEIEYLPLAAVLERWPHETRHRRNFSFWWGPYEESLELYAIPPAPQGMVEPCYVRDYKEVPADATGLALPHGRVDRAYKIYPGNYPPGWDELEYFVPYERALEALAAIRPVLDKFPTQRYPVEVRTIGAETGLLSPMYGRDSVSISVSGAVGTDYWGFLKGIDEALREFGARPHWGKTHFFDEPRLRGVFPCYDEFVAVRRQLDPEGVFLNDHLRALVH